MTDDIDEDDRLSEKTLTSLPYTIWKVLVSSPDQSFSASELMRMILTEDPTRSMSPGAYSTALAYLASRDLVTKINPPSDVKKKTIHWKIVDPYEPYRTHQAKERPREYGDRPYIRISTDWKSPVLTENVKAWSSVWRFGDFWRNHSTIGLGKSQ